LSGIPYSLERKESSRFWTCLRNRPIEIYSLIHT
jgi:hypothetical protein